MDDYNKERLRLYQPGDAVVLYGCFPAEFGVMETLSGVVRSVDWHRGRVQLYFPCDDECRSFAFACITAVMARSP